MKQIPLTRGKVALVDDEDFDCLSQYKWQAYKSYRTSKLTFYAARSVQDGQRRRAIQMHREILGLRFGDGVLTDHEDGDGLNNQKYNLRRCTPVQNSRNRKARADNSCSKYKGVRVIKNTTQPRRWYARISVNGLAYCIGYFYTEEAAALAYNFAAQRHFGEFAKVNVM